VDDPILATAKVALSQNSSSSNCRRYQAALTRALSAEPPACGTPLYRDMFCAAATEGQWIAMWLITSAVRQGTRASGLWPIAANFNSADGRILRQYAANLAERTRTQLRLLDVAFPNALDAEFRSELETLAPRLLAIPDDVGLSPMVGSLFDHVVGFNLAELREATLSALHPTALTQHCAIEAVEPAVKLLSDIQIGQLDDVAHSARWIDRASRARPVSELTAILCESLRRLERKTCEEAIDYTYHQRFGNYP
jgi:hypothetical protein